MNTARISSNWSLETQRLYRDNYARHILNVSLYLQSEIMNALTLKHGHSQLRINFEPYITLAGKHGRRLSDIADVLGISRQAANQVANQIEAAGYLQRTPDPVDGRAKLLTTTPRAKAMIRQGACLATELQGTLATMVGEDDLAQATDTLFALSSNLHLLLPYQQQGQHVISAALPRLSGHVSARLQALTMARGHPSLKRSFGAVLTAIGPRGGRIQQMADSQDVSKQAISVIVSELEDLGYIERQADPDDGRQIVLVFSHRGRELIADSVAALEELRQEFSEITGAARWQQLTDVMARIYQTLHLEEDVFGHADASDPRLVARQLTRQLGDEGARAVARLILSGETSCVKET